MMQKGEGRIAKAVFLIEQRERDLVHQWRAFHRSADTVYL